jgi:hypothetical protein
MNGGEAILKRLEPEEVKKPSAEIIFFPEHRIKRRILSGNRVYEVKHQEGWGDERRDHAFQGDAPKSA